MIKKYIFKEFLKCFILFFLSLVLLFWIADFFSNISVFLKSKTSFLVIIKYFLLKTPQGLFYIIPFAILTAGMFLFGTMNLKYELVAFRTLTLKKIEIYKILFILGILFYIILFFNNEILNPKTFYESKIIKNVYLKNKKNYAVYKANKIWYKKGNYILKINFANFDIGFMEGITLLEFNYNFELIKRIDAKQGFYISNKWDIYNVDIYNFSGKGIFNYNHFEKKTLPIEIDREDFVAISSENKNISFVQLFKIIMNLKNSNIDTIKYKTDLIDKFCYPLVCIVFIFISFILNIRNPRDKTGVSSVILSVVIGFGFFIIHSLFINLAYIKIIPYFIAPFLVFIISGYLIYYLDKKIRY